MFKVLFSLFLLSCSFVVQTSCECGDNFTSPNGVISSPNYPDNYPLDIVCEYRIIGAVGSAVVIIFERINLESDYDWLKIYDGLTTSSKLIAKLDSSDNDYRKHVIIRGRSELLLQFRSDGSDTNSGFQLYYKINTTGFLCGGDYNSFEGEVTSFNYPFNYLDNMFCEYRITAPDDNHQKVIIELKELSSERSHDWLTIYNGSTIDSTVLANLTGELPLTLTKLDAGNSVLVQFRTDNSSIGTGERFKLKFNFVFTGSCDANFTSLSGSIISPNYPGYYPMNITCEYRITAPEGKYIAMNFSRVDLPEYRTGDHIWVYNGPTNSSNTLAMISRHFNHVAKAQANNVVLLLFRSFINDYNHRGRFNISYQVIDRIECDSNFSSPSGEIKSVNYPYSYPDNISCDYRIIAPDGDKQLITILIEVLSTELSHDWLRIYNGTTIESPLLAEKTGNKPQYSTPVNWNVQAWKNALVQFRSGPSAGNGTAGKFKLTYSVLYSGDCGGNYSTPTGELFSPNYPHNYINGVICDYKIVAPSGRHIILEVEEFSTEQCCDSLTIHNGPTFSAKLLADLRGQIPSGRTIRAGHSVLMRFRSDGSSNTKGFKLNYHTVNQTESHSGESCGNFTKVKGEITSPNYPGSYPENVFCEYRITARDGRRITLELKNMSTELSHDWLVIYDGKNVNSPVLANLTGQLTRSSSKSTTFKAGDNVLIRFKSDGSLTGTGFRLVYHSIQTEYFNVTQDRGTITTPRYPNDYPAYSEITWNIMSQQNNIVVLILEDFDLENGHDHLVIHDNGNVLANLTGHMEPIVINSKTDNVSLQFKSDSDEQRKGFNISYKIMSSDINMTILSTNTISKLSKENIESITKYSIETGYNCIKTSDNVFDLIQMEQITTISTCYKHYFAYFKPMNLVFMLELINKMIMVKDVNQTKLRRVNSVLAYSRDLVINLKNLKLAWTVIGSEAGIFDMSLNGSDQRRILSNAKQAPTQLTIDYQDNLYYFIDIIEYTLYSIDFQGGNEIARFKSVNMLRLIIGMSIVDSDLYLANPRTIYRIPEFSRNLPYYQGHSGQVLFTSSDYRKYSLTELFQTDRTIKLMNISTFGQVIFEQQVLKLKLMDDCNKDNCPGLCVPKKRGSNCLDITDQDAMTINSQYITGNSNHDKRQDHQQSSNDLSIISLILFVMLAVIMIILSIVFYRKLRTNQTNTMIQAQMIEMNDYDHNISKSSSKLT